MEPEVFNPFPSPYEEFIYKSRYSRWIDKEQRREDWHETVSRYLDFLKTKADIDDDLYKKLFEAIYKLEVMPAMRALMTAGVALDRSNVAGYNCSYLPIVSVEAFDEAMYILMNGVGVGFSVEKQFVNELPEVPETISSVDDEIVVEDSKEGWAAAFRILLRYLYSGRLPRFDFSLVRPAGARLKTFGGRASGPEPLRELFEFVIKVFRNARGRQLKPIECHDIMCKIGEIVVVGGVRRSAMISLSDLDDVEMKNAKSGEWWTDNPQRALANNSAVYETKPSMEVFMEEWHSLFKSKSGERGIFNRKASQDQAARNGRRQSDILFGTNPCSEIILRPYQFCNLTEAVIRFDDNVEDLERKVEIATILGTIQATLTDFPYLRDIWKHNTEEERLLGVSLTGIYDNISFVTYSKFSPILERLKRLAVEINKEWSEKLGINQSTAITCIKPSGTVSQLVNSASGIHPRWSEYYIRSVCADNKDPLTKFLKSNGFPHEPEFLKPKNTTVFYFPQKSPQGSITRQELTASQHFFDWMLFAQDWCEHKPSITINIRDHEWMEIGAKVYENFDKISGISFLPYSDHSYKQAPYQECSKEEYEEMLASMPTSIDWHELNKFEKEDTTIGMQTMACSGDFCELVDLVKE